MPVVENSVTIQAPIAKVFDVVEDPERYSEWFQGVRDTVGVTRTDEHVGDSWTVKYSALGITFDVDQEVTDWVENDHISIRMGGAFPGTLTTTLTSDGDSTTVTQRFDYEIKGGALGKAMNKLVLERMNAKNAARSLDDLKDILEQGTAD